jgi:peptidoglycan hydrolase-like protein with peptidoglycan-binding domain
MGFRLVIPQAIAAVAFLVLAGPAVDAQTAAPPPSAADAALTAQKAAFLALPESTRKAVQDALIWLGFYNGVADGDFGRRTRDALLAFQASVKASADGALAAPQLKALLAAAEKAREAVGFQVVSDAKSGARIGAPTRLLNARAGTKLEFATSADPDLNALYVRFATSTPNRNIAYKAIKLDAFFVVSGRDGMSNFYARFDKNPSASPPIRGFTFAYPASQAAQLDRIALAVANSFEPFPETVATPTASAAAGAPAAPEPSAAPPTPNPGPTATALVVAPGKALTALKAEDCPNPMVGGKPIRFERTDAATRLAVIGGDFGSAGEPPPIGAPGPDVVVLGFAGSRLAASPASFAGGEAGPAVFAAVEASGGGGPVFDRRGALVALIAPFAEEPKRVAGVALAASHAVIASEAIRAFLGTGEAAPAAAANLSAGDIAGREKEALVAIFCEK